MFYELKIHSYYGELSSGIVWRRLGMKLLTIKIFCILSQVASKLNEPFNKSSGKVVGKSYG